MNSKIEVIKRIAGVIGAELSPDNLIELTGVLDQYDRSSAKEVAVSSISSAYLYRDVPPYSAELEAKFLGSVLLNPSAAMIKVRKVFRKDLFFMPAHEWISQAITNLYDKQQVVTTQSVIEDLRNTKYEDTTVLEKIGGPYAVEDLVFGVSSWEESEDYGQDLLVYWTKRKLVDHASEFIRGITIAKLDTVHDLRLSFMNVLQDLSKSLDSSYGVVDSSKLSDLILERISTLIERRKLAKPGELILLGKPTALHGLTVLTSGWQGDRLIVIGARPGMGKSGFMLSDVIIALLNGESVLIFSLEMSALDLGLRLITMLEFLDSKDIMSGELYDINYQNVHQFLNWLDGKGIFIVDTPGLKLNMIREIALSHVTQHSVSRIYVDYLQLVVNPGQGSRELEIAGIARGLKNLSKETNAPVIAFSQLSRAVEMRGGTKHPQLSDFRESGDIENSADLMGALYRPEYYKIEEDEEGMSLLNIGYVIILKHRQGRIDTIKSRFEYTSRWVDIKEDDDLPTQDDIFQNDLPGIQAIPPSRMYDDEDIPWET